MDQSRISEFSRRKELIIGLGLPCRGSGVRGYIRAEHEIRGRLHSPAANHDDSRGSHRRHRLPDAGDADPPVRIGYPIWTAVGTRGTVLLRFVLLDEQPTPTKVASALAIIGGVAGLKATSA
jgi:hypothetical protein